MRVNKKAEQSGAFSIRFKAAEPGKESAVNEAGHGLVILRDLTWGQVFLVFAVVAGCSLLVMTVRLIVRRVAEGAPSHRRLLILRLAPLARLLIWTAGVVVVVPLLIEPTFEEVVALIATVSLALAFALKDYVSSVIAGIGTIVENTYQPGDWIESTAPTAR